MYVRYIASVGGLKKSRQKWAEFDNDSFKSLEKLDVYAKEIYFYPTKKEAEKTYLQVLGYEKSGKDKIVLDRVWTKSWVLHVCVGGRGYYDDILVDKGTCFLSWPFIKHTISSVAEAPLEFYWIILRGDDVIDFVENFGFSEHQLVFKLLNVDSVINLFKIGLNTDYNAFDIYKYSMGLATMLLSFSKPHTKIDEKDVLYHQKGDYTLIAKRLIRNSGYTISVNEIAYELGVSSNYLNKVFRNDSGESLKKYIMRKKFEFAATMLKRGITPTEVAKLLKYSNYSAFHRMFVARFGIAPSQYAEQDNSS